MPPTADPSDKLSADAERKAFGRGIYPWAEWFDGSAWKLSVAKHFPTCKSLASAYSVIRVAAHRRGVNLRCRLVHSSGEIVVKAVKHDAKKAPRKNVEGKRAVARRSLRNGTKSTERGQLQSRRRKGRRPPSEALPGV